jgi:hypothetical protein
MIGYAPGSESQFFFNSGQVVKARRLATFMGVLEKERNAICQSWCRYQIKLVEHPTCVT